MATYYASAVGISAVKQAYAFTSGPLTKRKQGWVYALSASIGKTFSIGQTTKTQDLMVTHVLTINVKPNSIKSEEITTQRRVSFHDFSGAPLVSSTEGQIWPRKR